VTEKGKLNTVHNIHPSDQLSAVILITTSHIYSVHKTTLCPADW